MNKERINITKNLILLIGILFIMSSCMGGLNSNMQAVPADDSGITTDGGSAGTDDASDGTDAEAQPVASLPLPALKTPPIGFVPDAEDYYPVVGQAGAVEDFEEGDLVAVSSSEFDDALSCVETQEDRWSAGSLVRGIAGVAGSQGRRVAGKSSYGDVILNAMKDLVISTAHAEADTCEDDGTTTYCPISEDGSYECFASFDTESVSRVYVAVVDDTCTAVSEQEEVTVQAYLHYLGSAPTDIKVMDGTLYSAAGDNLVKINSDESGVFTVAGDNTYGYNMVEDDSAVQSGKLAYASADGLVGVLDESSGIQILIKDGDTITNASESGTDENATSYTFLRPVDGVLYFGYEQESNTEAYLMYAAPELQIDDDPDKYNKIYIMKPDGGGDLVDEDGDETPETLLHHTKTLAWDSVAIGAHDWTVVSFEDGDNIRTRLIQNYGDGTVNGQRLGGLTWKTTSEANIKDIITYYDNNSDEINFAVLDDTNSKVWIGNYLTDGTRTLSTEVAVGTSPQAMYYSETSGKLYVLNQTGKSVSIIQLMTDATTPDTAPVVSTTLDLDTYITDIEDLGITLEPNSITLETTSKRLLITDTTSKGLIVVDVNDYETAL